MTKVQYGLGVSTNKTLSSVLIKHCETKRGYGTQTIIPRPVDPPFPATTGLTPWL